jgi:hypothetical protein
MLLPVQDDARVLDEGLQVLAGDLHRDAPAGRLLLPHQPRLDPRSVEIAVDGLIMEPQQAARRRVVQLQVVRGHLKTARSGAALAP